jgi:branched-subunit amino acid ABC-type transport system permease component
LGALAGIAGAIVGGAIIGPIVKQLAALGTESSVDETRPLRIVALHRRLALSSKFAVALLVIALVLMVTSHFG